MTVLRGALALIALLVCIALLTQPSEAANGREARGGEALEGQKHGEKLFFLSADSFFAFLFFLVDFIFQDVLAASQRGER